MSTVNKYTQDFFDNLIMDSDKEGHNYKFLLSESIYDFLDNQTKDKAYVVYSMFFDIYRISNDASKSFVDLLDVLKGYEENASTLSDGQRDHYVHSVNVFILGICIYSQNQVVRHAFSNGYNATKYIKHYSTNSEEFLFNWGIASLFHDIGYPLEIINNQMNKFIGFVAEGFQKEIGPYIEYKNFDVFNEFSCDTNDAYSSTDLIAECISNHLQVDYSSIKNKLDEFLEVMQNNGFVDHGFYSAIIVLRWYGEMLIPYSITKKIFEHQIKNAATAIFLHNAYKNIMQKSPFELGKLDIEKYPLAYLLILCDEAQEWNREAYGEKTKRQIAIDDSAISISDDEISFHYVTTKGVLNDSFLAKKKELFYSLLNLDDVFSEGLKITATTLSEQFISNIKESTMLPRLLASNIEKLAKQIFEDYNKTQLERNPDKELEYPSWDKLTDTLKYSNVRQAQSIVDKLAKIGCYVDEKGRGEEYIISEEEVEYLAIYEHDIWVEERMSNGWTYGEVKDVEKKTSPYLIPYDELTEEVKELDRDTIRNIPKLLESVGLGVYRK